MLLSQFVCLLLMWSQIFEHNHRTPKSGFFILPLSFYNTGLDWSKWLCFLYTFLYLSYGSFKRCWDQILPPNSLIYNQFHVCFYPPNWYVLCFTYSILPFTCMSSMTHYIHYFLSIWLSTFDLASFVHIVQNYSSWYNHCTLKF